ncbi:hypothetical protein BJ741DRAFT_602491 [Chytriomyces cf. hyalinus JEL632]|nr:hypothetical protein BJ741DRAFT_602491 [Chytriomyces cf. hyalinus JEL632]
MKLGSSKKCKKIEFFHITKRRVSLHEMSEEGRGHEQEGRWMIHELKSLYSLLCDSLWVIKKRVWMDGWMDAKLEVRVGGVKWGDGGGKCSQDHSRTFPSNPIPSHPFHPPLSLETAAAAHGTTQTPRKTDDHGNEQESSDGCARNDPVQRLWCPRISRRAVCERNVFDGHSRQAVFWFLFFVKKRLIRVRIPPSFSRQHEPSLGRAVS